ncbi:PREDICTED: seipin-2-like [Tarenaya hassleriana]|uniref:seipin-2-like n=1 Tax=Tarenaya hassleriana TaxID=28532 RepID=UPI00053C0F5C|nr:PREDICTED: seipin-2-like [Tarenaya hassleriana]XP_010540549.1 PREDICTED: seipin-2-like [Tarenaya hassleriana]
MSSSSSSNPSSDEEYRFSDASEEFFHDCLPTHDDSYRPSSSHAVTPPAASNLRRRKSVPGRKLKFSVQNTGASTSSSSSSEFGRTILLEKSDELSIACGKIEEDGDGTESFNDPFDSIQAQGKDLSVINPCGEHAESSGQKRDDLDGINSGTDWVDPFQVGDIMRSEKTGESTVTTVSDERVGDSAESAPPLREPSSTHWSLLACLVGLMIKAIEFEVSLMIRLMTFPPWLCYTCCVFVLDPFGTMKRSRRYISSRVAEICDVMMDSADHFLSYWLKDYKPMLKVVFKFGWGLFWAIYVGIVLVVLLVLALLLSGFVMRHLTEEPLVVEESLNFDYTRNSPEAYVPITSCVGVGCDHSCKENTETGNIKGLRVIPQNHKIEIVVSLTLPESEYNRNLGMFQVGVDFLSTDGQTLASSRRPCMLKFRSEPIRLVQTLLKIVPLVTGYVSETQTLSLKFEGFVEKETPTACIKAVVEQRAEFRPGAGVPELYDASMLLQSELSFFKRIIWNWRKTLFVWISMSIFVMELLFTLVCCIPLIIPRARHRDRTASMRSNTLNLDCQAENR